ncbi:MAG: hypothetical protein ACFFBD_20780 [Candidatus Hodarchaeota archaeon]
MRTIEDYLQKLETQVVNLGGDRSLIEEYESHLRAEYEDYIKFYKRDELSEETFVRQLEPAHVIARSLVGNKGGETKTESVLNYFYDQNWLPIRLYALVILVTAILPLNSGLLYGLVYVELIEILKNFMTAYQAIMFSTFILDLFNNIFTIGLYFFVFMIGKNILKEEKRAKNNVGYSLASNFVLLWILSCGGALVLEVVSFLIRIATPFDFTLLPSFFVRRGVTILLSPLIPILIIFFLLAYENSFDIQSQIKVLLKDMKEDSFSILRLPIAISLLVLVITAIQVFYSQATPRILSQLSMLYDTNPNEIPYIVFISFFSAVEAVLFLFGLLLTISLYVLLYKLGEKILRKEKEGQATVTYSLKDTILRLWIFGMGGALGASVGVINLESFLLLQITFLGLLFYFLVLFSALIAPLPTTLIVLFLMAYQGLFNTQVEASYRNADCL